LIVLVISKNTTISRSRPHLRALSLIGSVIGRVRLDIPIINTTYREEPEELEVKEVKREFKIKLLDTYDSNRAKLTP
jgi:hypothetical protein